VTGALPRAGGTARRLLAFAAVGALATVVHVGVASGLIVSAGRAAPAANGVAFCVATLVSYALNARLTFRRPLTRGGLARFLAVALGGLGLSMGLSGLAAAAGWHYLAGIGLVVLTVPPLTYAAHSRWTYRRASPGGHQA
jgi:putative flippase GtrA